MERFNLPKHTVVNKSIPKNAFDKFTNTKQKQLFVDTVDKIRWLNKISKETVNLPGKDIKELQVFEIQLRKKDRIETLLDLIDRSIPYHIIFILVSGNEFMISLSEKHSHPTNEDQSVIDWTFRSKWFSEGEFHYQLNLKESIDFVFSDICFQVSGKKKGKLSDLIKHEQVVNEIRREISKLEGAIKKSKQFNQKVELNLRLRDKRNEMENYK
jgi:hypothetical protein